MAKGWRSLSRVRRYRASSPQGSSSNRCYLISCHHGPFFVRLPFPAPTVGTVDMYNTVQNVSAEYGSTGEGCQSCSWSAEQGKHFFPRENIFSLSQFAPRSSVSRDGFGRPNPRQPAHSPHSNPNTPKRFDIFPPDWGVLRRSRCVQIFL